MQEFDFNDNSTQPAGSAAYLLSLSQLDLEMELVVSKIRVSILSACQDLTNGAAELLTLTWLVQEGLGVIGMLAAP